MKSSTTIYIYNENGIIKSENLDNFCLKFQGEILRHFSKQDVPDNSTIYVKFADHNLIFIIYDQGYVMKIEGTIKEAIILLSELDKIIDKSIEFYISPTQRIENSEQSKYPRGASIAEIAKFLDIQFCNKEYTSNM